MKKTRLLSLLLVALLASQTLASCDSAAVSEDTTAETTPAETEPAYLDDLGDLRFDGEEFVMYLATGNSDYHVEEETGDVMDDAIYERNRVVEERLGITLTYVDDPADGTGGGQAIKTNNIRQFIMSGDDTYDVYIHVQHTGMPGLIAEGCFTDWNGLDYVDFSKPYWYANCLRDINYGDKIMAMTGLYNIATLTSTNCLFFNKRLFDEYQLEYPYQDVLDGTWTIDKFRQMVEIGTVDIDGDTKINFETDQIGYWGWGYESVPAMFMGLGGDILLKNESDGQPVLNVETERNIRIVDAMRSVFNLDGAADEYNTYGIFNTAFTSGRLLFVHGHLSLAPTFRDMEDDFGFVPYPKLDEAQDNYNCRVQNTSGLTYIPVTNNNLSFTGAVLECMASVSYETTVPAFFDVVLTVKTARDTESEQMVPIIRECASFNDEAVSGFSVRNMIAGTQELSSYWAGVKAAVEDSVQKNILDVYFD
ncbi:MAG: extracellular solute-binding protein [Clostridia bacterium]|nr:extracellular solute-binding protein [Clostridia bacterium]